MAAMRPIPLEELLVIYALAVLIGYGRWRHWLRGAGWSIREKQVIVAFIVGIFFVVAVLDAFYNHRLGLRQF
jgi:hypothetical protein